MAEIKRYSVVLTEGQLMLAKVALQELRRQTKMVSGQKRCKEAVEALLTARVFEPEKLIEADFGELEARSLVLLQQGKL